MESDVSLRKLPISHRIARAEEIARENIAAAFGVREFAEAAGLSRSRFSVAYQNHRGTSAGCFLRRLRMERAVDLLKYSREPIAMVGKMVGYPEPTGFGRAFRRHTGLSPSRFRATVRKAAPEESVAPTVAPLLSMVRMTASAKLSSLPDSPPLPLVSLGGQRRTAPPWGRANPGGRDS